MKFSTLIILLRQEKLKPRKGKTLRQAEAISAAYSKMISIVKKNANLDDDVTSSSLESLDLSDHMKAKIIGWVQKNKQPREEKHSLADELKTYMGIGDSLAAKLIKKGLTSISQLRTKKWQEHLPAATRAHIEHRPLDRIPRAMIQSLERRLHNELKRAEYKDKWLFSGSYFRGSASSGDIDMVIFSKRDVSEVQAEMITHLRKICGEVYCYSQGPVISGMIIRIDAGTTDSSDSDSDSSPQYAKMDMFVVRPEHRVFMLAYSTGSHDFVVDMRKKFRRGIAQADGTVKKYRLNQYGLLDITNPDKPIDVPVSTEQELFDLAQMKYVPPNER